MIRFDPFGWLERFIPMRWLHRIIRFSAVIFFCWFFIQRIRQYHWFYLKPLWAVETLLYGVLVVAFLIRTNPVDRSRGIKEIVVPLIGSFLPFGLLKTCPSPWIIHNAVLLTTVFIWMTLATSITTWGMWTLRGSFSITVEARRLITSGPYRWVRHPIYLGEILSAAAVVVWRWSFLNLGILILFAAIQLLRTRWEEDKLERAFPGYRAFLDRSWWVLPPRKERGMGYEEP
jgi:protein-S-isoprenylcysteine O-methyltransferase Ste14